MLKETPNQEKILQKEEKLKRQDQKEKQFIYYKEYKT